VVQGAVLSGRVDAGGALTVQGVIVDVTLVGEDAAAVISGVVAGTLTISPGSTAIVQAVVTGKIVNAGRLFFDGKVMGGTIENHLDGVQVGLDAVGPELRAQLGTITTKPN